MANQFKTLFVIPPTKSMFGEEISIAGHPHVGIAYLAAMLKQNNISYRIIDMCLGYTHAEVLEFMKEYEPDLICTTALSYGYDKAYALVEMMKSRLNQPIVIGGPHTSAIHGKILKETRADFAVIGEGEYTLSELITELKKSDPDFEKIEGLVWRQDSKVVKNKGRPYIRNLDDLPFPAYEDFELRRYICCDDKRLPIITSRGCPYQCNFCSVQLSMGNMFRARSPESVVDELEYWHKKGWNKFDFNDDTFTLDMDRATRICELIQNRGLNIRFQLYNGIRADRVDRDLLEMMKKAGCRFLSYGFESQNNEVLQAIRKGISVEDIINVVNMTREIGIKQSVNFIIGHPTETYEMAMDSIKLAKDLKSNFVNFYNLVPYPNTSLFKWIEQSKNARFLYPVEVYLNKLSYRDPIPVFETDEFPVEEKIKALKKGFDLYEKTIMQFRFGKSIGYLVYLVTRNRWIIVKSRRLLVYTKLGAKFFRWVTGFSR